MALVHPSGPVQPPRQRLHNKQRAGRSREAGKHTIGNDAHKHYGRVRATRGHFQANLELLHPEAVALQPGISVHTTQSETKAAPTRKDRPTTCSALRLHNVQLPDGRSARRCACCPPPCVRLRPVLTCGYLTWSNPCGIPFEQDSQERRKPSSSTWHKPAETKKARGDFEEIEKQKGHA